MRKSAPRQAPTVRVGQLLFVVQQAAQALATERLGPLGLTPRAWGVLSTLAESGPLTQIELATTMSIDRTAMVYLIDELEERELVERVRSERDRRAFLIHLTANGRDTRRRAAAALAGAAETLLKPLSAAERGQLVDLLAKVASAWQDLSAEERPPGGSPPRGSPVGSSPPRDSPVGSSQAGPQAGPAIPRKRASRGRPTAASAPAADNPTGDSQPVVPPSGEPA